MVEQMLWWSPNVMLPRAGDREQAVPRAVCCWPQQDFARGVRGMTKRSCN